MRKPLTPTQRQRRWRAKKKVKKEAERRAWRVAPFVDHLAVAAAALIALTE
jgi:hypothetical protein